MLATASCVFLLCELHAACPDGREWIFMKFIIEGFIKICQHISVLIDIKH
jgi:hypothetical protein